MSGGPWGPADAPTPEREVRRRGLDGASRRNLRLFLAQLAGLSVVAAWGSLAPAAVQEPGGPTPGGLMGTLTAIYGLGGTAAAALAALRGEKLARGSLNGWDDALAYVALSRLAHFAHGVLA